jgi:hypothetical protein
VWHASPCLDGLGISHPTAAEAPEVSTSIIAYSDRFKIQSQIRIHLTSFSVLIAFPARAYPPERAFVPSFYYSHLNHSTLLANVRSVTAHVAIS